MKTRPKWLIVAAALLAGFLLVGGGATAGVLALRSGWQPLAWLTWWSSPASGQADVGLFCKRHGVPEKFCTLCHPELEDQLLMCAGHGVPEAVCTLCHPENEDKYGLKNICPEHGLPEALCPQCNSGPAAGEAKSDWCAGHGVPESLCTLCHPELKDSVPMCSEHGVPEAICTVCHPQLAANFTVCETHQLPLGFCPQGSGCTTASGHKAECTFCKNGADRQCQLLETEQQNPSGNLPRVRLAEDAIAQKAGLELAPVDKASSAPTLTANCEIGYDENRLAHVRPRVDGYLNEVNVDVGDRVQQGDVLAVVDSAELGEAKAAYLAAQPLVQLWQQNLDRYEKLSEKGIVAGKELLQAQAELARAKAEVTKARQRLLNFGLQTHEIASLKKEGDDERNLMRIVAPQAGVVVRRDAVAGEAVQSTTELFAVADLKKVWAHLDVYESDLSRIEVGQSVTVRIPGLAPREFSGEVGWIDSEINKKTRTVHVRAEVNNPQGLLRAGMFGEADIRIAEPKTSLWIPQDALQWHQGSYVVFVQKATGLYEPRHVLKGGTDGKSIQLAWADVRPGDRVVTTGSFLLKTELQKSSIGAGCCGE